MVLMEAHAGKPVDVQSGDLYIRLAETAEEIRHSQKLRYRVFCEEMAATPTLEQRLEKREYDSFDAYCDHLLVFDRSKRGSEAVVGTYRLMRREQAARRGQFYTIDEYDIGPLLHYPGEILELGRSCVASDYRTGSTMQLLWRGIAEYVFFYNIDVMFGCASLPATDPNKLKDALSYLYHHHLAPPALRPRAVAERYVDMNLQPADSINVRLVRRVLPPLVRGYLHLGGFVGDGAVVDEDFGTTDVAVVVKTDWVTQKYLRHYRAQSDSNTR
ncbi:MAG: GNAT family N-acyltransferase [Pseudomonadota bacterium]